MRSLLKGMMLVCILVCLFFLAACGQSASGSGSVTSLQITRSSAVKGNTFPAFTRAIHDQVKATQLYDAVLQLPTQKGVFCPLDNGLQYDLIFTQTGGTQIHILLSASGCQSVVLNSHDRRATDHTFWSLVEQIVGVTENDIFVKPI
jgi:hypothetical protein